MRLPDDPRHVISQTGIAGWALFSLVRANERDGDASTYPLLVDQSGLSQRHVLRLVHRLEADGLVNLTLGGGRGKPTTILPFDAGNSDMGVTLSPGNRDISDAPRTRNSDNRDPGVTLSRRNSDMGVTLSSAKSPPSRPTLWPGVLGERYPRMVEKFAELSPELTTRGIELLLADVERQVGTIEAARLEHGLRSGWMVVERKLAGAAAGTTKPVGSLKPYIFRVLVAQIREANGVHA